MPHTRRHRRALRAQRAQRQLGGQLHALNGRDRDARASWAQGWIRRLHPRVETQSSTRAPMTRLTFRRQSVGHDHELTRSRRAAPRRRRVSEPAVQVRGLRKAYGELQALDGVDLTVRRGEVLALLGPNGAGKTTLVEILEGHRMADSGEVCVLGFDPGKRERAFRERIGIVLQEGGLDPTHHGPRGRRALQRRLSRTRAPPTRCSSSSGSPTRPDVRATTLSGGQRRRLDLALGIAGDPELDLPRRADHRLRPGGPPPVVGADRGPARPGQDDPAHHPLHGRGPAPGRPRRGDRPRPRHRRGHAGHARRGDRTRRRHVPRCPTARRRRAAAARRRRRRAPRPTSSPSAPRTPTRDLAPLLSWAADARRSSSTA